jgi:biopolymer transport protein ExbD
MAKVKIPRKSISLDMTAMCDVAFLLLTFFILTTKFKPDDPVQVSTPSSVSETKLPDTDILTITVDKENRVFFGIDGQFAREKMLEFISGQYQIGFTPEEKKEFSLMSTFGVPIGQMRSLLALKPSERNKPGLQTGIPIDSVNNELKDWVSYARYANPRLRITIKGDGDASYETIKRVIGTLQDININKFNLITNLEARPKTS